MSKSLPKAPAASVALYDALLATNPDIERKGATMPYTSVNGNMFSLLTADGTLALRLPAGEREAFLKRYNSTLTVQYGAVMREYVQVPDALLRNPRTLAKYLDASYRDARSLKPKATTNFGVPFIRSGRVVPRCSRGRSAGSGPTSRRPST